MQNKFFKFFSNHPAVATTFLSVYLLLNLLIFYFTYIKYWNLHWGFFPFEFDSQGYGLIVNFFFSPVIYILAISIAFYCFLGVVLIFITDITLEKIFEKLNKRYTNKINEEKASGLPRVC